MTRRLYRFVALLMPSIFFIAGMFSKKMREGYLMRKSAPWMNGPSGLAPYWIHCASGEFEYAKPVIRRLKQAHPDIPIMVTYFSPSVRRSVESNPDVSLALPSPWESPQGLRDFINHHRPRAFLIARTDAWPEMVYQARKASIPSLLFSATLVPSSGRLRWPTRALTKLSLRDLTQIYCVSDGDAEVFASLGVGHKTQVAGDTRFDQVLYRLQSSKPFKTEIFDAARPKFVCGSTWPEDERELMKAMLALKYERTQPQWVLVPHEPTPEHLEPLIVQVRSLGVRVGLYSELHDASADVIIVDKMGILAELYQIAEIAFVGGSYRKTVHSVMEPLAAGCLTFLGPYYQNNREAMQFHLLGHVQVERDGQALGRDVHVALDISPPQRIARQQEIIAAIKSQAGRSEQVANWAENSAHTN